MGGMKTEVRERLGRYLTELNGMEEKLDGFAALAEALGALQQKTDELYRLENNEYIPMQRTDYDEIMGLYRNALTACDHYLIGGAALPEDAPAREVRALLGKDIALLNGLSFTSGEKMLSLPEAVEKARGYTVDLTGMDLKTKGGAQSTRVALEVLSESGRAMKGFFTETGVMDPVKQYGAAFKDYYQKLSAIKTNPTNGIGGMRAAMQLAQALALDLDGVINDSEVRAAMQNARSLTKKDRQGNLGIDRNAVTDELFDALDDAQQADPYLYAELMRTLHGIDIQRSLMGRELGLGVGSNIERRNMGMSIVANLLGRPELVAASVPMTVVNGKEKKTGIFMESAQGMEMGAIPFDHPFKEKTVTDAVSPEGLESLASLQILDYICMNIDRHRGNMFFRFNEQGQLKSVQGIDNDTSFGVREVASNRKSAVLAALDDLMVIPESLARTLNGLTKEMLQTGLRGVLEAAEIDAAWQRVENIQARIELGRTLPEQDRPGKLHLESGKLRTVTDAEWAELEPARLCNRPMKMGGSVISLPEEQRHRAMELDAENRNADRNRPDEFTNIFDVALSMPYRLRSVDRKRYEHIEDGDEPMTPEEALDALGEKMAAADSSALAKKDSFYVQTRAVSGLKAIPTAGDAAIMQEFVKRLEQSGGPFLEGREKYKIVKAQLQSFPKLSELKKDDVPAYRERLSALKTAAQDYLTYKLAKGEPDDMQTQRRVLAMSQIVEFADDRQKQLGEALEAEVRGASERKEREVAGTLHTVRGMANYIDLLEERSNTYTLAAPELSELGKTAMKALNGLIDYAMNEKPTLEQRLQMNRDVAAVMLFEIAANSKELNPEAYEQMKNHPLGWEGLIQKMTADRYFDSMTRNLTQERVKALASDPAAVRTFAGRYAEAQRIREKGENYRNAALDREHLKNGPSI